MARPSASSTCRRAGAWPAHRQSRQTCAEEAPPARSERRRPARARSDRRAGAAGGYEDGESWWRDVIEENPEPGPVFAAIADAMTALREAATPPVGPRGGARGAYAARNRRGGQGRRRRRRRRLRRLACAGAAAEEPATADRALLKGRAEAEDRRDLGAVDLAAPGVRQRLWRGRRRARLVRASVGHAPRARPPPRAGWHASPRRLRERRPSGLDRLADRGRSGLAVRSPRCATGPRPASRNCARRRSPACASARRCSGTTVARRLLIGAEVGAIPDDAPLAPLLEDLQREQKRVAAEARGARARTGARSAQRERARSLDPAASPDAARRPLGPAGRRRPQPRHLPRALGAALGAGIRGSPGRKPGLRTDHRQAAAGRMREADRQGGRAERTGRARAGSAHRAACRDAVERGIAADRARRAAQTSDCAELLGGAAAAGRHRCATARRANRTPRSSPRCSTRIVVQAALALPYAARGLDARGRGRLRCAIVAAPTTRSRWLELGGERARRLARCAAQRCATTRRPTPLIAGAAARLLYEAEALAAERRRRPAGARRSRRAARSPTPPASSRASSRAAASG